MTTAICGRHTPPHTIIGINEFHLHDLDHERMMLGELSSVLEPPRMKSSIARILG